MRDFNGLGRSGRFCDGLAEGHVRTHDRDQLQPKCPELRKVRGMSEERRFWTYDEVEARLLEAAACWRRMPDRERGWQWVCAKWPELKHFGEHVNVGGEFSEREAEPVTRRPRVTRAEIGEMEEATEWLLLVAGEAQRRTLVAGLVDRARGRARPGWKALREALGEPGLRSAAAGMRYSRAIRSICEALNR